VLLDERDNGRTAVVIVPDRQLSLSIGREGQNARLAAKLTGWRIDIKGDTEAGGEGLLELARQQVLAEEERKRGLLETVQGILREGREAVKAELEAKPEPAEAPIEAEREPEEEGKVAAPEVPEAVEEVEDTAKVEEARPPEEAEVVSQEVEEVTPEAGVPLEVEELSPEAELPPEVAEDEGEDEDEERQKAAKRRRDVDRRRHVVFDEDLGQTIAIRRRKRGSGGWDEGDEYL
jgi:N utilization substance protein A